MLKRLLLPLALLIALSSSVKAQYCSFVTDSATWIMSYADPSIAPLGDSIYGYRMLGDTVVNSLTYKKVYLLKFNIPYQGNIPIFKLPYHLKSMEITALVRETNKKSTVYHLGYPIPVIKQPSTYSMILISILIARYTCVLSQIYMIA
jgi:hypothetical protein